MLGAGSQSPEIRKGPQVELIFEELRRKTVDDEKDQLLCDLVSSGSQVMSVNASRTTPSSSSLTSPRSSPSTWRGVGVSQCARIPSASCR